MNQSKTVRRDWMQRQVEEGKMEVKCDIHLTDDYAFDNANGFGKSDWLPARIRHPKFEDRELQNGNIVPVCVDSDCKDGFMNMGTYEFSHGSRVWLNENGIYTLRVHSNLYYSLRPISK